MKIDPKSNYVLVSTQAAATALVLVKRLKDQTESRSEHKLCVKTGAALVGAFDLILRYDPETGEMVPQK